VGIPSEIIAYLRLTFLIRNNKTVRRFRFANVFGDSTVLVYISVYRIDGNAIINGSIHENGPSSPIIPAPDSGLMAYYPFNGNAADESDHGLNGQVYGATLTTDRFGEANRAYYFDGSSSGISAQVTSAFSLSKFTLTAWVKATGPGDYLPRIVAVGAAGTSTNYYSCVMITRLDHAPVTSEKLIFF